MVVTREYRSSGLTDVAGDEHVTKVDVVACAFEFALNERRLSCTGGREREPVGPRGP